MTAKQWIARYGVVGAAGVTVLLWASAFVSIRSAGEHFSPGAMALGRLLTASLALGGICLVRREGLPPLPATLNVIYLGIFPTTLGFTTWAYALARTTAGKMGATTYLVPVLVIAMSWLFLGQVPGLLTLAGGALCLAGVAVARRGSLRLALLKARHPERAVVPPVTDAAP